MVSLFFVKRAGVFRGVSMVHSRGSATQGSQTRASISRRGYSRASKVRKIMASIPRHRQGGLGFEGTCFGYFL